MKRLVILLAAIIGFASCKTNESNGVLPFTTGSYLQLVKVNGDYFDLNDAARNYSATVKVVGEGVEKVDVLVGYNANAPVLVKTISSPAETFDISLSLDEIAKVVGVPKASMKPGDTYTIRNNVTTKSGKIYTYATTNADLRNVFYLSAMGLSSFLACPYKASDFNGTFLVVEDGWEDYAVGDPITIKAGPAANEITVGVFATGRNHKDIVLTVTDLVKGSVNVPKQIYGDYSAAFPNFAAAGTGSVNGCAGLITLSLNHTSGTANYGTYTLRLKRK